MSIYWNKIAIITINSGKFYTIGNVATIYYILINYLLYPY